MKAFRVILGLCLAAGLSLPAVSGAQPSSPDRGIHFDADGRPYRAWDVAFTGGLHVDDDLRRDVDASVRDGDHWGGGFGVQVDVGRYWSSHLKTEGAVGWITPRDLYRTERVPVNGRVAEAFSELDVSRLHLSGAVTWQFLENTFAHPYVSAGVRGQFFDIHRTRPPFGYIIDGYAYQSVAIPPVDARSREFHLRPYLAAGYKSYLAERAFVRSELATLFDSQGASHWAVRIGIGVDF